MFRYPIIKIGNPLLALPCTRVLFPLDYETIQIIKTMIKTLKCIPEAAGLSANQIGINKRIIVYKVPFNRVQDCEEFFEDIRVLINPNIDETSNEMVQCWEGCLSLPEVKLVTLRHKNIYVSGFNSDGQLEEINADGFLSQCLQHEIDHINGITFFDRNIDKKLISHRNEVINCISNCNIKNNNTMGKY